MAVAEILDHAFRTPNGQALLLAPTTKQLEQTVKKEFFRQCPEPLISEFKVKDQEAILTNGFSFLFYTSDDPVKIRSLNLTAFYIEEASGVDYDIFDVCKTRLRSPYAIKYARDEMGEIMYDENNKAIVEDSWYLGIVCSNPDVNWIRKDFLLQSDKIYCSEDQHYNVEVPIPYYSSHIIKTEQNKYLHPDFIPMLKANKAEWWINRYLNGSFEYAEGLVYPMFMQRIVSPFLIPENWLRISGTDFGGRSPHSTLMGAIDPATGCVYVYDEYYKAGLSVREHQKAIHEMFDKVPSGRWYKAPVADPAGKQRSIADGKSLFEHFAEYGIYFNPATNRILDGLAKVYTYFDMGKLFIFSSCVNTVNEGLEYRYPEQKEDSQHEASEKPIDKNDHAMDCLKYMISELPDDPTQLCGVSGIYIKNTRIIVSQTGSVLPPWMEEDSVEERLSWY